MKNLLLVFVLLSFSSFSQSDYGLMIMHKEPSWSLYSFDVNAGYRWYRREVNRLSTNDLVKNSDELQNQSGSFYSHYWPFDNPNRSHFYEANVGFRTAKKNRFANFGVNYTNYSPQYGTSTIDYTATTIDTLSLVNSSGISTTILLDSVWIDRESIRLNQKVFSVKGEYVFRTQMSRLTGYAGFGGQIGVSLMRQMNYGRAQSWIRQYADTTGYPIFQNQFQLNTAGTYVWNETTIASETKEIKAKAVVVLTPYLPVGIEFSPFMNGRKLSSIRLELKGIVGAEFHIVKDVRTNIRPFYSASLGLKYVLRNRLYNPY